MTQFCSAGELLDEYVGDFPGGGEEPNAPAIGEQPARLLRIGVACQLRRIAGTPHLAAALTGRRIIPGLGVQVPFLGEWFEATAGDDSLVILENRHPVLQPWSRLEWGSQGTFGMAGLLLARSGGKLRLELMLSNDAVRPRFGRVSIHPDGAVSFASIEVSTGNILPHLLGVTPVLSVEFYPATAADVCGRPDNEVLARLPMLWAHLGDIA